MNSTEVLKQEINLLIGQNTLRMKLCVWVQVIYDTDKFRADEVRTSLAGGYGYKILRTEKFKASNEISGYLNSDLERKEIETSYS